MPQAAPATTSRSTSWFRFRDERSDWLAGVGNVLALAAFCVGSAYAIKSFFASQKANALARHGQDLAEWEALKDYMAYCQGLLDAHQHLQKDCERVLQKQLPPPPTGSTSPFAILTRLVKRHLAERTPNPTIPQGPFSWWKYLLSNIVTATGIIHIDDQRRPSWDGQPHAVLRHFFGKYWPVRLVAQLLTNLLRPTFEHPGVSLQDLVSIIFIGAVWLFINIWLVMFLLQEGVRSLFTIATIGHLNIYCQRSNDDIKHALVHACSAWLCYYLHEKPPENPLFYGSRFPVWRTFVSIGRGVSLLSGILAFRDLFTGCAFFGTPPAWTVSPWIEYMVWPVSTVFGLIAFLGLLESPLQTYEDQEFGWTPPSWREYADIALGRISIGAIVAVLWTGAAWGWQTITQDRL